MSFSNQPSKAASSRRNPRDWLFGGPVGRLGMLCIIPIFHPAPSSVRAQTPPQRPNVSISVLSIAPPRLVIRGGCAPTRVWSFRKSYAGVMDLGSRIENLKLEDASGKSVPVRSLAAGEYEAAEGASKFSYEVDLAPPARPESGAFVSWLSSSAGVLRLGDLLPELRNQAVVKAGESARLLASPTARAGVRFGLPESWAIYSTESQNAHGEFEVQDLSQAVFVIGARLRITRERMNAMDFALVASGDWAFADDAALELTRKIVKAHAETFGRMPGSSAMLIIMPFPKVVDADMWSAETLASTVTLLLGRQPSKTAALAQLSVPLTHELLHLWVPNGLALEGDYAWFYEGFTIYQAARTAVRLDLLTFSDFLSGLGRAYDAYTRAAERDRWSLVDASERRWTIGEPVVYQKSMLVALLYDLTLRTQSRGKRSLDDVYRELFRARGRLNQDAPANKKEASYDGTRAVIATLGRMPGMEAFTSTFIQHVVEIDLEAQLAPFGLTLERAGGRARVGISESLSRRQRDLLRQLGYNDYVRSSTRGK